MRGKRRRAVRDGLFEQSSVPAEGVDSGRCRLWVAVAAEVIGSERVDRDENDVVRMSISSRAAAAGSQSDDGEDHDERVSSHVERAYTTRGRQRDVCSASRRGVTRPA